MDKQEFYELLVVSHEGKLYVVKAPSHVANQGDLVEFAPGLTRVMGEVADKLFCTTDSDEYRCISKIVPIYPARRIYKMRWEAWEGNDEECGG